MFDDLKPLGKIMSKFEKLSSFQVYIGETDISDATFGAIASGFYNKP